MPLDNVILIWPSTNASIPAGFSRVTDLDDKFIKGYGDEAVNTTGGNESHTHTSTASHSHTIPAHTHTITFSAYTGSNIDSGASNQDGAANPHNHAPISSGAVNNASCSSISATYTAAASNNNRPPYYDVIFIQRTSGTSGVPDDAVVLWDSATIPSGWYFCDGANSTPNLANKYLRGASAGGNSGGTGGATNHSHVLTHSTGHSVSHGHAQVTSGVANTERNDSENINYDMVRWNHTHTVSLNTYNQSTSSSPTVTTTETVEPEYRKLAAIQNQTGSDAVVLGMIALWLGSEGSVPYGWDVYSTQNNKYLKIGSDVSEIGNTGGNNTHTHANNTHTHDISHSGHTATVSGHSNQTRHDNNSQGGQRADAATHATTISTATLNLDNATTSAQSSNNEPPYRTVIYIKYTGAKETIASTALLEATTPATVAGTIDFDAALFPAQGIYRWVIHDKATDMDIADVTDSRNKSFSINLNQEGTAQFTMNLSNALASSEFVGLGRKDLHIYRNNTRVWGGEIAAFDGTVDATGEDFNVVARSYESLLKDRYTGAAKQFNAVDAGQVAWTMINESQQLTNGDFGITSGEIQASVLRTRLFEYKNIYEAISELSEVENGIEWEITPYKEFNVYYPQMGTDRSTEDILEYGGNVEQVRFAYDFLEPGNRAIVLGAGSGAGISYADEYDTTSRTLYGLRERVVPFKDVSDQTTLDAKANRVLEERKNPIESLEVVQARGAGILAFTRVNLGDQVRVKVKQGLLDVDGVYRVRGLNVEIANDGTEKVTYTVTTQPRVTADLYDILRHIENQLAIWASTNYALAS